MQLAKCCVSASASLLLMFDELDRFKQALVTASSSCRLSLPNLNESRSLKCIRSPPLHQLYRWLFAWYFSWKANQQQKQKALKKRNKKTPMMAAGARQNPASLCVMHLV